jgi:hypothetical protein
VSMNNRTYYSAPYVVFIRFFMYVRKNIGSKCGSQIFKEGTSPNVVVEWLTLLLRIREVPGSNR